MIAPLFPVPLSAFDRSCTFIDFHCGATLTPGPGIKLTSGPLNHPNHACGYRLEYGGRVLAIEPNATVVLASGYVRPHEVEAAKAIGIKEVILKPNTVEEMTAAVERLLEHELT